MSDKPALPAPGRISIRILNLSTEVQSTLREVGIRTVGHLFRPTEAQQAHLRERLVPASARELLGKTRSFYRTYRKVQKLLAEAESVQTDTPVGEQALKERPQPAEMPVEDEESPLPGASAAEEEMVAEVTGKRIEQPASNHGAAAEAALAEVPIAELSVPGPALARLEQRGIETALDLAERSDAELAEIRYVGAAVIARIRNQLRELREEYARNATSTEDDSAPPSHDKSSIEVLELSASAFHALSRAGIHQLHQLLALTHEELLDIRSLGPTLAHEIEERLEEYLGQSLAEVRAQSEVKQKAAGISKAHLRAPLSALNLTTRAHNALQRSGVETVRALLIMPEAVLAQLYGVGDTALNDIQEKLDAFLARPAPVEPPALTLPALPETDLPEVLEAWFDQFLSSREREIVERRYGLFSEGQTLETIGEQFGVTRERIRQIQLVALEKLESDLSPIAELLELARGELATKEGILPLETWADMLQAQPFSLGAVRPRGLLDLLSDLEETWIVYAIGEGVLFDGISTRAKAEAKLAEWQSTQTGSAALVPSRVEEPTAAPEPLPKQVPRPQTRKVTAADLAPTSVPSTAVEVEVAHDSPFYEIEMALREKLSKVDFIGELAIEEEQFREWCELVQTHAVEDGRFQPRQIPPAAFVTQMVFAARYSEEEARNFWQPYAQMVWGLEEASQYFQLRCRNRFKQAIAFLTEHYDLFFPQRSAGDLVRPIYRHAIIPAYLERKFVDWLKSHWREILETPEGFLIPRLRQERSLNYLSPTLQNFIQGADTAETAAALIRNMATAASLHAEGEALADIHDLLAGSPIEQSLWDELSQVYVEQADLGEPRRLSHRLEWLWNLETGEMQLRLRNLYLTGDVTPYQIVWVEDDLPAEEAVFADVYETLDPWEVEDEWLIDEVVFAPDGPLNGVLKVLGDDDSLLRQLTVPPLPKMPAQFFRRLTHQEVYAIPVTPDNVQTGQYLVAVQPGVHLSGPENEVLEATSTLTLPYLLHDHFESAGFYEIDLPLTILEDGAEMETLTPSATTTSSDPAYIYGEAALAGLSRRVPPLYCSDQIWLVIPGASERLLAQGTVEIRPQQGRARRLLLKEMEVEADETGALWVPLRGLMGRKADGTYTVELRRGLRSLLQAPLQFSCIPGFEAIPPPERPSGTPVYTPNQPPAVRLRGIEAEQIGSRERLTVTTGIDGWIEVTWHDLRGGCRLPLSINNQQVPLEWPVSRFFAWVEPAPEGNVLTWEMVKEATLHAVATESVDYFFVSVGANPQRRQLSLDRYGRKRIPIWQDQLYDMLRHERGAEVKIYVSVFNENWSLFTLRRHPELHGVRVKHDPARDILIFENNLKGSWPGDFHFQVQQLSNPSATPRVLESVRQLESRHLIPCELADGIYQFEVWDPGAGRALAKEIFGVGEVERSAFFDEAVRLLESLSRDTAHRLPRWLGGDMIRFLAAETDRTEEGQADLAPEWLWQLALLQPRAYAAAADDELEALWSPLLRLRQVHQVDEWEEEHGLLPDWAVMPFRMTLRFQPFGNSITIEPEVVSREGRRGIGHAFLKMGEDHRPVYVSWKPHYREQVVVTLGLPDQSPDDVDYVQLDEWDMYSVYQCRRCGRLVDSNIAPEVLAKHRHGRQKADLEDVLTYPSDYRLLAEVTPKRREEIRDYRLGPAYFVDRQRVRAWLNDPGLALPDISNAGHPLGPDAYLHISSRWVARYRQSFEVAQALQELVGDRARRKAFARLAAFLSESRWFDVGAWAALGRFLAAFPSEPDEPLLNVDRYSLMLALLARTRVHAPARADQLRTQIGLHDAKLAEMLQLLNRYCPELVVWAFNWVELFFIHAAG